MPHILIIEARFYENIADNLKQAALAEITNAGFTHEIIAVPGCFEIPAVMAMAIANGKFDGYVALGCVIRGQTTHYDYVCSESARGINDLAIKHRVAVGYGIITAENREQANHRADINGKNVGGRAAKACIEILQIKNKLEK